MKGLSQKNSDSFRPDFGLHLQSNYVGNNNSTITLADSFVIEALVMYSNGLSSITGRVDDKVVTFDFNDVVLKVFMYIFTNLKVIDRTDLENRIREQQDEPIVIKFEQSPILVNGMVLACKFGKLEKSTMTDEEFLPLVIESAKIVQQPAAVLI